MVIGFSYIYSMKPKEDKLVRFISISESHQAFGLPAPQHPLISLVHFNKDNPFNTAMSPIYDVLSFYKISFITKNKGRLKYGRINESQNLMTYRYIISENKNDFKTIRRKFRFRSMEENESEISSASIDNMKKHRLLRLLLYQRTVHRNSV